MTSKTLTHLKFATQHQHDQLETVSFAREIMSQKISYQQYKTLLDKTAAIYQTVEPAINQFIDQQKSEKIAHFISHRLADVTGDLGDLASSQKKINLKIPSSFQINSRPALIGNLYVLEGARLGGKVIVKALRKNPQLTDISGFRFYQQTAIDTRQRWLNFMQLAEETLNSEQALAEATQSASAMFSFFYDVHRQNGS